MKYNILGETFRPINIIRYCWVDETLSALSTSSNQTNPSRVEYLQSKCNKKCGDDFLDKDIERLHLMHKQIFYYSEAY